MTKEIAVLDVRGLNCPLPVLKAKKAMKSLEKGEQIIVESTDPLSVIDIPTFCEADGHELVKVETVSDYQRYLIIK